MSLDKGLGHSTREEIKGLVSFGQENLKLTEKEIVSIIVPELAATSGDVNSLFCSSSLSLFRILQLFIL